MANLQTCLKFAVGLSTKDCQCLEDDRPSDFNKSLSGFYLDDMDHGIPLEFPASLADCGNGNVWDLLEAARTQGINEFNTAFLATMLQYADNSIVPSRTQIGMDKFTSGYYVQLPIIGFMLKPKTQRGGVYHMTNLNLTMNGSELIEVKIFSSADMVTPITTVTFNSVNNTKVTHQFSTPIDLPFTDAYGNCLSYYFLYERTNSIQPVDNKISCGCGDADQTFKNHFDRWSVIQLSNWESLNSGVSGSDEHAMGIQIQGSVTCDTTQWMCMSEWDFTSNPFAAVISKVIQLISINKLIGNLLQTPTINRYTLMGRDGLLSRYNMNRESIGIQMAWIGQQLSKNAGTLSDCFTCKANSIYNRTSLLV